MRDINFVLFDINIDDTALPNMLAKRFFLAAHKSVIYSV